MTTTQPLAARAEAMLNRIAQAKAEENSQQAGTEIAAVRKRANTVADRLCAARDAGSDLTNYGVAFGPTMSGPLLQQVTRARTALRTAATSMIGAQPEEVVTRAGSRSVDDALDTAEKLSKSVLAGLIRSVERWRVGILPADISDRIVTFPGTSDVLVVRLLEIQRRLQEKVENVAAEQLALRARQIKDDADAWAKERPKLDSSLQGRHPDVQEFLRQAATEEGAPWGLITPVVANWLGDPENTVGLRVVLRS